MSDNTMVINDAVKTLAPCLSTGIDKTETTDCVCRTGMHDTSV